MVKDIDWANIGFSYTKTDYRFISDYKNGKWDEGRLSEDAVIRLDESAGVLQYAQTCFEGLKAYRTVDGHVVCFRPDLNAKEWLIPAQDLKCQYFRKINL